MASLHKEIANLLTLALILAIFLFEVVSGDLAPNEDFDENIKPEAKKPDEIVTTLEPPKPSGSNLGFIHAFIASFSVIIVSEIGDKTFFIAAIMSMVNTSEYLIETMSIKIFILLCRNIHG